LPQKNMLKTQNPCSEMSTGFVFVFGISWEKSISERIFAFISGVEKLVSFVGVRLAEEFFIKFLNLGVLVALAKNVSLVFGIKSGSTFLHIGIKNIVVFVRKENRTDIRLAAAVDAAAGTTHDFDELIGAFAFADLFHKNFCVFHSVGNGKTEDLSVDFNLGFFDSVETADGSKGDCAVLFTGKNMVNGAESSFHNAAGYAEDYACAGSFAHNILVEFFIRKFCENDTASADHIAEFAGCDNCVNVFKAFAVNHFGSFFFKFFRGAGHYGNNKDIFGVDSVFFRIIALDDCALHLVRRFAGRKVVKLIRIISFAIVYPARGAGSNHRKNSAVFHSAEKLGSLFHNGKVCAEIGIINFFKAESSESCNHFSGNGGADRHSEFFAKGSSYCRSGLDDHMASESHCFIDFFNFGFKHKGAGGADGNALSAEDAGRFVKTSVSGRSDYCVESAVFITENAVSVGVFASCNASSAKNAFAGVANDGRVKFINGYRGLGTFEHFGSCAGEFCNVKKFAFSVFVALLAVYGMVGKKKFNGSSSCGGCFRGGNADFHTFKNRENAGSNEASHSFNFNKANTAGTLVAFAVVEIAKGRNFISAGSCRINGGKAFFNLIRMAFDFNIDFAHFLCPPY